MDPPLIHLASPASAGPAADRVYYAVGRSLTAADFARQGRYVTGRLLGLTPPVIGVLSGLGLSPERFDSSDGSTGLAAFTIGIGSGIASNGRVVHVTAPIAIAWSDLVQAVSPTAALADGAYLLLARTVEFDGIEGPPPDPALRAEPDPMLDIRRDSFVEIWLSAPVGALPAGFLTPAGLAAGLNTLIAGFTEASLAAAIGNGVPLAMVLVQGGEALVLRQAAGRLAAEPRPLDAMLLAQVRDTFTEALGEAGADPGSAAWQMTLRGRLRVLPPAGELPVGMLLSPTATTANCPFFPPGMAVHLQFIRASQAPHLLHQAHGRPRLDLANDAAPAVTLSLAVPDGTWSPDLLDIPRGDPVLAADLHLAYARARATQVTLRQSWVTLYGGIQATIAAQHQAIGFLVAADTAAQDISFLLSTDTGGITLDDLRATIDTATSPTALLSWVVKCIAALTATHATPPVAVPATTADGIAQQFAALGYQIVDPEPPEADPAVANHAPAASDTILAPLAPSLPQGSDFGAWSAAISAASPDPEILQPLIDAGIVDAGADAGSRSAAIDALLAVPHTDDTQPGALLGLAIVQLFYAVLVRIARSHEYLLEAHSRMIALQRQHLDIMSTYVSALAGGVPSDGSGLSFTRIIPFFDLRPATSTSDQTGGPTTTHTPIRAMTALRPTGLSASVHLAPTVAAPTAATRLPTGAFSASTLSSMVRTITANGSPEAAPQRSTIGSRLGTGSDIARTVAADTNALSQAPPFVYQPVEYGAAAHITTGATLRQISDTGLGALQQLMRDNLKLTPTAPPPPTPTPTPTTSQTDDETAHYAAIATSMRTLLRDVTVVENNAIKIENGYFLFRDRIQSLETRIAQLTSALASDRDALRNAQAAATRTAGDYAAAQRLVQEETDRLGTAIAAREHAIAAATGLFYERELQTIITRELAPALTLTADAPADVVPGCSADHAGPPAALQPFLDLLLEVPLGDWSSLRDGWIGLPDHSGLQRLVAQRAVRLANRVLPATFGAGAAAADLADLANVTHAAFEPLFRTAPPTLASLAEAQRAAFSVLALPDIVTLPVSLLRSRSEALRGRIESAAGCLFETLAALAPSARFALASLARSKTLSLLDFAHWPLPTGLGDAGAVTVRRLAALVDWMAAQLHAASSAAAQTALGNLVAAAVMAAAYGDPDEAVTGTVATTGGVPRPGLPIRVALNRRPPIGTALNLFDETQAVVATIRVEDHDARGTTATVITSYARSAPTGAWSVAAMAGRAPWLPS